MKNEYTVDEMRLELAKAIKEKIDAYSQKLVELRNRELAKAEEVKEEKGSHDNCPLCGKEDAPHACVCLHKAGWKKSAAKEEVEKCGDMSVAKTAPSEVEKCGDMATEKNEEVVPSVIKSAKKPHADIAAKVNKGELMIDRKNENVPGKRLKEVPEGSESGVLPSDKKSKVIEAEGSGGDIAKGKGVKKSEEELEKAIPGRKTIGALGAAAALATGAAIPEALKPVAGPGTHRAEEAGAAPAAKPVVPAKKKVIVANPVEVKGHIAKNSNVPAAKPPTAAPTGANPPKASNTSAPKNAPPKATPAPKPPPAPGAPAMKGEEPANKFPEAWKGKAKAGPAPKSKDVKFDTGKVRGSMTSGKKAPAVFVDEIKKSELGNCVLCGKNEHAGNC